MQMPKKFFGSEERRRRRVAYDIRDALIDTGSKMDEVIFEEFKATGNMELHLDRRLVDKRGVASIDISRSGTRREELLLDPKELELVYRLRRVLSELNPVERGRTAEEQAGEVPDQRGVLMTMSSIK